jgi:hypothetical protein
LYIMSADQETIPLPPCTNLKICQNIGGKIYS